MAGPSDRFLYVNGVPLSESAGCAHVTQFEPPPINRELEDVTGPFDSNPALCDSNFESSDPIKLEIMADSAWQDLIDSMHGVGASPGVARALRVACWGFNGKTAGDYFVGGQFLDMKAGPKAPPKLKTRFSFEGTPDGAVEPGQIILAKAEQTADGDTESSSIDNTASSAGGGAGYLQVFDLDLDGADGLAVKVRDSADNITFSDLVSFTALTDDGAERVAAAGAVDRYLAVSWDFTGSPGSPTAEIFAGFARL